MAGLYNLMILGVMLIGVVVGVEGVTDQQFQELSNLVKGLQDENKNQGELIGDQAKLNAKQTVLIEEQSSVIGQLKEENRQLLSELETIKVFHGMNILKSKGSGDEKETMQNVTIEERVALLEIQVSDLDEDVTELDENVDFLFEEQVIQDERLLNVEERMLETEDNVVALQAHALDLEVRVGNLEENGGSDGNSSISELEERVETLEGTVAAHGDDIEDLEGVTDNHETRLTAAEENIQGLQMTDISLDARISALEDNGGGGGGSQNSTIAFHAVLTSYTTIYEGSTLVFNQILTNLGSGYDSTTGVFTVPPDGDGVYYFSTYLLFGDAEYASFDLRLNDETLCAATIEESGGYQNGHASCNAVVSVVEGDEINIVLAFHNTDDGYPLWTSYESNGFTGFRV